MDLEFEVTTNPSLGYDRFLIKSGDTTVDSGLIDKEEAEEIAFKMIETIYGLTDVNLTEIFQEKLKEEKELTRSLDG